MNYDFNPVIIEESFKRIKKYIVKTPLMKSNLLSDKNTKIYFKMENRQKLNCCKIRGAFAKLTQLDNKTPIIAVSSGNHGLSISYASKILGFENTYRLLPFNSFKISNSKPLYTIFIIFPFLFV